MTNTPSFRHWKFDVGLLLALSIVLGCIAVAEKFDFSRGRETQHVVSSGSGDADTELPLEPAAAAHEERPAVTVSRRDQIEISIQSPPVPGEKKNALKSTQPRRIVVSLNDEPIVERRPRVERTPPNPPKVDPLKMVRPPKPVVSTPSQNASKRPAPSKPAASPMPDREILEPPRRFRLNRKVLSFALKRMGQQVGNGECWTLAADALAFARARPAVGYEFGREIPQSETMPGDILQFHTALFVAGNSWQQMGAPHHTAIVYQVRGSEKTILHQNFGNDKTVQKGIVNFDNLTKGSVKVFRPVRKRGRRR